MKSAGVLLPLCLVVLFGVPNSPRAATEVTSAKWIAHEFTIRLRNLPKRYSCEELRVKFRDVLVRIGARSTMQIRASRCEGALGARAASPRVDLRFELPQALHYGDSAASELAAVRRRVELGVGAPESIDASDCEILRQINWFLLAKLPTRIVEFNLTCRTQSVPPRFRISIEVLVPVDPSTRKAAGDAAQSDGDL